MIEIILNDSYNKNIKIIFADSLKYYCYQIFTDVVVDYKKLFFIIWIKANM